MNQILYTGGKKKSGPANINKVIKFFCISILIFGLVLVGEGSYAMIKNSSNSSTEQKNIPTVTVEKQGNEIVIKASHNKAISKIVYNWNNGEETVIDGKGQTYIEEKISLPVGNNTFNIKVVDVDGKETTFNKNYEVDSSKPQLSLSLNDSKTKIKIIAKDNEEISYITYRWDDEQETRVESTPESSAQIECEIDIPKGHHVLTVVAVNINNLTEIKTQEVAATTKPQISVEPDGEYVIIKVTDEEEIKLVMFTLNGQQYRIDCSNLGLKEVTHRQQVQQGENMLQVKAYNIYDVENETTVRYNPNP